MGQAQDTIIKLREIYDLLDQMQPMAQSADQGYIIKSGDINVPIPPEKIASIKSNFSLAHDKLRALVASLHDI